jgi:hypothetical protein
MPESPKLSVIFPAAVSEKAPVSNAGAPPLEELNGTKRLKSGAAADSGKLTLVVPLMYLPSISKKPVADVPGP